MLMRLHMDIQQLPAIEGSQGYEYKISLIDLATRVKYCEIHPESNSETVAAVFQRALDSLPPCLSSWRDNAMTFTMKYTAHRQRKTAFIKAVEQSGGIHALIAKASAWRNGIIERSNRTNNEELFHQMRFGSSEERRYYLKLWEYHYNEQRPHQGIGNRTPMPVYRQNVEISSKLEEYPRPVKAISPQSEAWTKLLSMLLISSV
jgi:transposase InsO family protein